MDSNKQFIGLVAELGLVRSRELVEEVEEGAQEVLRELEGQKPSKPRGRPKKAAQKAAAPKTGKRTATQPKTTTEAKRLAKKCKDYRSKHGLTQGELAKKAKVNKGVVTYLETCRSTTGPKTDRLLKVIGA